MTRAQIVSRFDSALTGNATRVRSRTAHCPVPAICHPEASTPEISPPHLRSRGPIDQNPTDRPQTPVDRSEFSRSVGTAPGTIAGTAPHTIALPAPGTIA